MGQAGSSLEAPLAASDRSGAEAGGGVKVKRKKAGPGVWGEWGGVAGRSRNETRRKHGRGR